jgi:hypothetical protein
VESVVWLGVLAVMLIVAFLGIRLMRRKNVDLIARHALTTRKPKFEGTRHLFFCLADHFEPFWNRVNEDIALRRVREWLTLYPGIADQFRDGGGRPPQHAFFYPAEEYHPRCVAMLADLQQRGYGTVEVHLHHDRDTSAGFREKILAFKDKLNRDHGLLHKNKRTGQIEYGFIHGMFALDDSGPNGKWCGVRDEITILKETGCYADFTFPSAPDSTQPPILNRIYYATDDPTRPRSHHTGTDAEFGKLPSGDLLIVTGPLAVDWRRCMRTGLPSIENAAISSTNPPTPARVDIWIRVGITVKHWPSWVFVKVHTHGAQERVAACLLDQGLKELYAYLLRRYNDGRRYVLHFVGPREIYCCVKALESANAAWIKKIEDFDYNLPSKDLL